MSLDVIFAWAFGLSAVGLWSVAHAQLGRRRLETDAGLRLVVLDGVVLGLIALALVSEAAFYELMQEDGPAEWATFFAFAAAGLLYLAAARSALRSDRDRGPKLVAGAGLLALAVFCVFVAGEEISWAQRMFAFTPPDYFLEENFQQELNVHNLMKGRELWGIPLDSRVLVGIAAAGYGLVLPLAVRLLPGSVGAFLGSTAPSTAILWSFAAVAWAEAAYPISLAGVACELALGVAFVAAALETLRVAPGGDAAQEATGQLRLSVVSLVGPLALGGLTAVALGAVFAAGDEDRIAQTRAEIVALATDLEAGAATRRLFRKRSIHKRLYTSVAVGYLKFGRDSKFLDGQLNPAEAPDGEGRRDRQGYFLDPWSNPYWIRTKRRSGEVVVYSFDPNRKRDSDMDDALTFSGDDIGVILDLDALR